MFQYNALNSNLRYPIEIPEYLEEFASFGEFRNLPRGLLDLDLETGLVEVAIDSDKRVNMKFGKLLSRLEVPEAEIPDYSAKMSAIVKAYKGVSLQFAVTADEIEYVYENGPRSCMSTSSSVRAYESPNIQIAFVEVMGRIVARAVLNMSDEEDLRYSRIYGDEILLRKLLSAAEYSPGDLDGCTLAKIENDSGIRCPYLDCGTNISIYNDYLKITWDGDHRSQNVEGYIYQSTCEDCSEPMCEDETCFCEERELSICTSCWENSRVWVNGDSFWSGSDLIASTEDGEYFLAEEVVETEDGDYHQEDVTYCEPDNEYRHTDNTVTAIIANYDEEDTCAREYCTEVDGVWVHDEYLDEYCQIVKQEQLELDMESAEEAVVEVLAFVNKAVREVLPMSQCVEIRGTWVHKDFQFEYNSIIELDRTLNEPNHANTWYN